MRLIRPFGFHWWGIEAAAWKFCIKAADDIICLRNCAYGIVVFYCLPAYRNIVFYFGTRVRYETLILFSMILYSVFSSELMIGVDTWFARGCDEKVVPNWLSLDSIVLITLENLDFLDIISTSRLILLRRMILMVGLNAGSLLVPVGGVVALCMSHWCICGVYIYLEEESCSGHFCFVFWTASSSLSSLPLVQWIIVCILHWCSWRRWI